MFLLFIGDIDQIVATRFVRRASGGAVFTMFAQERGAESEQGAVLRTPLQRNVDLRGDAKEIVRREGGFHRVRPSG